MSKIFKSSLVIDSMKDSGYKDAAHAVAEVVDNSIQAAESLTDRDAIVNVICVEQADQTVNGLGRSIEKIAVYDNASGMDKETLWNSLAFGVGSRKGAKSGMGKFGMGLPNASISQADKVEIWSWQNNQYFYTYLDIDEVVEKDLEEIPEPEEVTKLDDFWVSKIDSEIESSGTLVVWSKLSRLKWKRHKAFFQNSSVLLGRMYRYYLTKDDKPGYLSKTKNLRIQMRAFNKIDSKNLYDDCIRPYDPMYLLDDAEWNLKDEGARFSLYRTETVDIDYKGGSHTVVIRGSVLEKQWSSRQTQHPGNTKFGQKDCNKNLGVSVVREGRELELNRSFVKMGDPKEKFWSVEVLFPAALDELFGVTNNKQSATAFRAMTMTDLEEEEGLTEKELKDIGDLRYLLLSKVTREVNALIKHLYKAIPEYKKQPPIVPNKPVDPVPIPPNPEVIVNPDPDPNDFIEPVENLGFDINDPDIQEMIKKWAKSQQISIESKPMPQTSAFFSAASHDEKYLLIFNEDHDAYNLLIKPFELLQGESDEAAKAIIAFKLLIVSFVMVELKSESPQDEKTVRKIREKWGMRAEDLLSYFSEQG